MPAQCKTCFSLRGPTAPLLRTPCCAARFSGDLEDGNGVHQRVGLLLEAPRSRGGFLGKRGVLLRDLVDLSHA